MLSFRPLVAADQDRLWHWLHVALWDPPPAPLRPIEVLQSEGARIYAENWGRPTDLGIVAQVDGVDAGACWLRLLPPGVGLGSVDAMTPQLGIALEPEFQHKGHGRPLMMATLAAAREAGYRQVSLTVHPLNPAQFLYERCGFRAIDSRRNYLLMVANLVMTEAELAVQRQLDAYNAKDMEAWLDTYHEDAEQFELHGARLAGGHKEMRARMQSRFAEPDLHAELLSRTVMGNVVMDYERVTRNFPEGKGTMEMVCLYEVRGPRIAKATFALGPKKIDNRGE